MTVQSISLDIGGTFTDFVVRSDDGAIATYKSSTSTGKISDGIFNGLAMIARRRGVDLRTLLATCESFSCGTTVATNAILERKTSKTGLICTEGFRDTLVIREGGKTDTYNLYVDYPEPYVPRRLTFGVRERVNAEGGVETPLDEAQVREVAGRLKGLGVEAIAVSLIWAIANPAHELRIGEILAEACPGLPVSLGHRVHPTIREFRRASATAIDASLKPIVHRNIHEVKTQLEESGFKGVLTFITSNGGRTSVEEIIAKPVYLCMSGPSAISHAGAEIGRMEGLARGDVITVDMGGTSFDISVTTNWSTPMHREGTIGGELFGVPSVEVLTIGAGGGSIARVDAGGFIHVGPESAGAYPGPACYQRGGMRPTVTDANLARGLLDPEGFADGQMKLSRALAERAIDEHVGRPLGMSVQEAANLITLTIEQNMVAAIEEITVRRGVDPREYTLVSGGSAGGLHAAAIARELGMRRVIVPRAAGVLSAFGIDRGDVKFNFARSLFATTSQFDHAKVNAVLADLEREGVAYLNRMNVPQERRTLLFSVEARYAGQVWQLTLPIARSRIEPGDLPNLIEAFHRVHERHYMVRAESDPVEFTEWNLIAVGKSPTAPSVPTAAAGRSGAATQPTSLRPTYLREAGGAVEIPVFEVDKLGPGAVVQGPALIQDKLTVTLIPPNASGALTVHESILIDLNPERAA